MTVGTCQTDSHTQHALRPNVPICSTVQLRRRHSTCLEPVKRRYTKTHFAEGILSYHSYVRLDIAVAGKRPFACPNLPVTTRAHHSMLPQDNPTISYRMNCLSGVYPTTRVVETLSQSVQQKTPFIPICGVPAVTLICGCSNLH